MAVLATNNLTLMDWAKRLEPNGGAIADLVEILSVTNEILSDAVMREGNEATGHTMVIRTGLPTVYWRALNAGVPTSKSTTAQVKEAMGMLEAYSEIDADLVLLNGNSAAFRASEDKAFVEAMNQAMATTMFYGNPASDPKQFMGLAPRYSSQSAGNAPNIIDAGGVSTDNTSIWLVIWGDETVFCPFPKGSQAGLKQEDLGKDTIIDANGGRFQAWRTHFQWKNGLAVKDWRYVVRIANIDVSNLVGETSAANLAKLMIRAIDRIPNLRAGRAAFYMNRTVSSAMAIQGLNNSAAVVKVQEALDQYGRGIMNRTFMGIPVRISDAILNTEARVV